MKNGLLAVVFLCGVGCGRSSKVNNTQVVNTEMPAPDTTPAPSDAPADSTTDEWVTGDQLQPTDEVIDPAADGGVSSVDGGDNGVADGGVTCHRVCVKIDTAVDKYHCSNSCK